MFTNRVKLLKYIPVYLGFTAYLIIGAFIRKGGLAVSDSFSCSDLIDVLFVGITEEMVFRGWLLNVTVSEKRKWLPIIINAVMFLLIHFPIWIKSGVKHLDPDYPAYVLGFADVFVLLVILSVLSETRKMSF